MSAASAAPKGRGALPALIASLILATLTACAHGQVTYWQHDPATAGDWQDPANWTDGVPTADTEAVIDNAGLVRIDSVSADAVRLTLGEALDGDGSALLTGDAALSVEYLYTGWAGTGTFTQTGGTNSIERYLYLGMEAGSEGSYLLADGLLAPSYQMIGRKGIGSFTQTGGTCSTNSYIYLGYYAGSQGMVQVSGDSHLHASSVYVGWGGEGEFTQISGMVEMTSRLVLGGSATSSGTYDLHGGTLTAGRIVVGQPGAGLLAQDGGSLVARQVVVGPSGRFDLTGGTIQIESMDVKGVLDFGGAGVTWSTDVGLIDLVDGQVLNSENVSVHLGTNTLLAVPAGVDPADLFGTFSSTGLIQQAGTPLTIPAGRSFTLSGLWRHPIHCEGTLGTPTRESLDLTGGLTVSGNGHVDLYRGDLTIPSGRSGISGGSLGAFRVNVGAAAPATFAQSAGDAAVRHAVHVGHEQGLSGTYELTGGNLSASYVYVGDAGAGLFVHDAGTSTIENDLILGREEEANGEYRLSQPGTLAAEDMIVGYSGTGAFVQAGGTAALSGKLTVGLNAGSNGQYLLGPGAYLSADTVHVGQSGTGLFVQTGGTNAIEEDLTIGATGRYELSAGDVSARTLHVGANGAGELVQTGGAVAVDRLEVGDEARYELSGGTVDLTTLRLFGTLDFAGSSMALAWDGVQLDLTGGSVVNASNVSLTLGPDTLVMFPAGFDPHNELKVFSSAGSVYLPGSSLVVPAGRTIELHGHWDDRVICEGTVRMDMSKGLDLAGGVNVTGDSAEMDVAIVPISDEDSGITAGFLDTYRTDVGGLVSATFTQTGGTHTPRELRLGHWRGPHGAYRLEGGELEAVRVYVGHDGSGTFVQTGGTCTVGGGVDICADPHAEGTYEISAGLLNAPTLTVAAMGTGTLRQTGGTVQADDILVGPNGWYQYTGGTLAFSHMVVQGRLDLADSAAEMGIGKGLIDLTAGSVVNAQNASMNLGAGTLLLTPPGFDPYTVFASFQSDGVVHTPGATLVVPYGTELVMDGTIADHVDCRGSLSAPVSGQIMLTGGLTLSGEARVDMGSGALTVEGGLSQVSGGRLEGESVYVGYTRAGTMVQTGGQVATRVDVTLGRISGADGTYHLRGGEVSADSLVAGRGGTGKVVQSDGQAVLAGGLYLGQLAGSQGRYELGGGLLSAYEEEIGSEGDGVFVQTGGENRVERTLGVGSYDGGAGTYQLIDGVVAARYVSVRYAGLLDQTGGSVSTDSVYVSSDGRYRFAGGVLGGTTSRST